MASTLTLTRTREHARPATWVAGVLLFVLAAGFMTTTMAAASMAPVTTSRAARSRISA